MGWKCIFLYLEAVATGGRYALAPAAGLWDEPHFALLQTKAQGPRRAAGAGLAEPSALLPTPLPMPSSLQPSPCAPTQNRWPLRGSQATLQHLLWGPTWFPSQL